MIGATLVLGVSISILGASDGGAPSGLVAKLGSGQFAEREAAARGLEKLGADALAPLRAARADRDPEVRARAAILLDKIEKRLLVRPTLVTLDADDRPVAEVVRDLGNRTGMPPTIDVEGNPLTARKITVRSRSPIPYWAAIDLICDSAGLRSTQAPQGFGGQGSATVLLFSPGEPAIPPAPTSDSGPFRVKLVKLDYHRERTLELPPGLPASQPVGNGPRHRFSAQIQVSAEPRLFLAQAGPIRIEQAVDDSGRSLLPAPPAVGPDEMEVEALESGLGGAFPVTIPLRYPEPAGRSIGRLRGTVPVIVAARKSDPLVVSLGNATGKTYRSSEVAVTVEAVRSDPNEPQSTVELSIRPKVPGVSIGDALSAPIDLGGAEFLDKQVEILDAQGRPFLHFPQDVVPIDGGYRVVLVLAPVDGGTRPATLRFHGLVRTSAEIPFDFKDVAW